LCGFSVPMGKFVPWEETVIAHGDTGFKEWIYVSRQGIQSFGVG